MVGLLQSKYVFSPKSWICTGVMGKYKYEWKMRLWPYMEIRLKKSRSLMLFAMFFIDLFRVYAETSWIFFFPKIFIVSTCMVNIYIAILISRKCLKTYIQWLSFLLWFALISFDGFIIFCFHGKKSVGTLNFGSNLFFTWKAAYKF